MNWAERLLRPVFFGNVQEIHNFKLIPFWNNVLRKGFFMLFILLLHNSSVLSSFV